MQISEVLASSEGMATEESISGLLIEKIEVQISKVEHIVPMASMENTKKLKDYVIRLSPFKALLSDEQRLQLWKHSYRLWNACVDIANAMQTGRDFSEEHVKLRHISSEMLTIAGKIHGIPSALLKTAIFFHKTGVNYHKIRKFDSAVSCFDKATELVSNEVGNSETEEYKKFCFDLLLSRAKTAWEMSQRTLTCTYLGRAKGLLSRCPERFRELAEQYLVFGKCMLSQSEQGMEAVMMMNQAFEICSDAVAKCVAKNSQEKCSLEGIKLKALRYLAAAHLQGEDFQNVLKCVAVLKAESDHPTTAYLALKAYIGLSLKEEAQTELMKLARHSSAPVDICLSAVESFIQAGLGGLDIARSAFYQMLNRFPSKKELPVRVLDKILKNLSSADQNYKAKVALALQIASDEAIVKLFEDSHENSGNERRCMHALLWNSGSELFREKLYETSITLFEGSMLYIPLDAEHSMRRAKSLRVLCLCHLALSQYDRADEYITEAEKVEPSIICLFLKYKVRLQMKDEAEATALLSKMFHCPDFDPDYLTLATHEAIACKAVNVAISSLSNLLKLYDSGKQISTKEVVVLRNMILLHTENTDTDLQEVLHYLKYARRRLSESGREYFGSGIVAEKELNWFAGSSWNSGMKAGNNNNFDLCAESFACASDFYGALEESIDNLEMLSKSLILSVAAFLSIPNKTDTNLTEASEMLEKAKRVHANLANKQEKVDESFQLHALVLNFDLKGRMKEHKQQLQIIEQCTALKACKADILLRMGLVVCQGEHGNLEVATAALNACLNMVLSSPIPDYKIASLAIRKTIWIADAKGDDTAAAAIYRQAYHIILGTKSGEYPTDEAKWLVCTAWNRSGVHVRFNRIAEAKVWMNLGLDLVQLVPSMGSLYSSSMSQSLAQLDSSASKLLRVDG